MSRAWQSRKRRLGLRSPPSFRRAKPATCVTSASAGAAGGRPPLTLPPPSLARAPCAASSSYRGALRLSSPLPWRAASLLSAVGPPPLAPCLLYNRIRLRRIRHRDDALSAPKTSSLSTLCSQGSGRAGRHFVFCLGFPWYFPFLPRIFCLAHDFLHRFGAPGLGKCTTTSRYS